MADTITLADYPAVGDGITNNNTAIQNAVNAALADEKALFWPKGTYLKSTNIIDFHKVRHLGPGIVKHGSDLFYVEPRGTEANKLYLSTTGNNTNDGLTSAFPMRQLNYIAGTVLLNYGPLLDGVWTIQAAAGTYTDRVTFPAGIDSTSPINIKGPAVGYPNAPTAIWKEGYNISAAAFKATESKCRLSFTDLLYEGYNGSTSSAGIQGGSVEGTVTLTNVWFTDCYWGFTNQDGDGAWVSGVGTRCGFLGDTPNTTPMSSRNGNGGAYRGLMHSRHSIGTQNAGTLSLGPKVVFSKSAFFIQESCTGHVDWTTIEDCDFGINLNVNSRVNVDGTSFKRNTFDLKLLANSHAYLSANTVFGSGADESDVKVSAIGGSQVTDENRIFTNVNQSYNTVMKISDTKFPNQSISTTSATVFYTLTLAGNLWRDVPYSTNRAKRIKLKIYGELIGTNGTKNIIVRLGSTNVSLLFTATEVGKFQADAEIFFNDQAAQFLTMAGYRHLGTGVRLSSNPATNALTANTNLTAEAAVGNTADTVRIDAIDMSWG